MSRVESQVALRKWNLTPSDEKTWSVPVSSEKTWSVPVSSVSSKAGVIAIPSFVRILGVGYVLGGGIDEV